MHISFTAHDPKISTSSKGVMEYLEKENYSREKDLENFLDDIQEMEDNNFDEQLEKQNQFFSNIDDNENEKFYSQNEATDSIDQNKGSRHKDSQSNFYMINVSPSKQELEHLKNIVDIELRNKGIGEKEQRILEKTEEGVKQLSLIKNDLMHQALREYSRDLMKEYAEQFDRRVYVNPDNLPSQKEEKIINEETKKEIEKLGLDKKSPIYSDKYREIREQKAKDLGKDLSTRKMTEKDLVWYGKVEESRTYKGNDKWVIQNKEINKEIGKLNDIKNPSKKIIKQLEDLDKRLHRDRATGEIVREGLKKGGDQYHVHIIVSRYDNCPNKRFKGSISPNANQKGSKMAGKNADVGFNRDDFFKKSEKVFDDKFKYQRQEKETYQFLKSQKNRNSNIGKDIKRTGEQLLQPLKKEVMRNTGMNEINKLNMMNNVSSELGFRVPMSIPKSPLEASIKLIRAGIQKINEVSKGM